MLSSNTVNNITEVSTDANGNTTFTEEAVAPANPYNGARFFYRKTIVDSIWSNKVGNFVETAEYTTFAYKYDDLNQCLKIAVAQCSLKDRFVRAVGRSLALSRLESISDYATVPYKMISASHDTPKIRDIIRFLNNFPEPSK